VSLSLTDGAVLAPLSRCIHIAFGVPLQAILHTTLQHSIGVYRGHRQRCISYPISPLHLRKYTLASFHDHPGPQHIVCDPPGLIFNDFLFLRFASLHFPLDMQCQASSPLAILQVLWTSVTCQIVPSFLRETSSFLEPPVKKSLQQP
jgi:hypothetical protein